MAQPTAAEVAKTFGISEAQAAKALGLASQSSSPAPSTATNVSSSKPSASQVAQTFGISEQQAAKSLSLASGGSSQPQGDTKVGTWDGKEVFQDAGSGQYYSNTGQGKLVYGSSAPPGMLQPGSSTQPTPQVAPQQATTAQTGQQAYQQAQSGALTQPQRQLTMPASGSVVDLLNMAGQDSSFAARKQLAAQYGIQNYSGTAAQNTELANKYMSAYNSLSGKAVPQTAAEARGALLTLGENGLQAGLQNDPVAGFYDMYSGLDPVTKQVFDVMQQTLSSINTRTSLTEEIMKLPEFQERADIKAELLDLRRIMDGTEDDIREEITMTGGFATESQVQGMATARNKVLLKQANALTDQFNVLNDYITAVTDLTKADREQVERDLTTKLGIAQTMYTMQQQMQNAERENYKTLVNQVGYAGVAQMTVGNPAQARKIESLLGLGIGGLQVLASYQPPMSEIELLQLENQKLQNQRLRQELAKTPASAVSPEQKYLGMALQQQTIADTDAILSSSGLNSAVGPNALSRIAVADAFGAKSNFIASVEQLRGQMTLDKLVQAKGSGATFGALSDTELKMIAGAASKLGTWAIKDDAGNVTGYSIDENSFKKELDTINYFQKLDYVLKGGSPASVGAVQMADGTYWVQNSDGTYTKL